MAPGYWDETFPNVQDAITAVKARYRLHGYGCVTSSSTRDQHSRKGQIRALVLACDRGKRRKSRATTKVSSSTKVDCPWRADIAWSSTIQGFRVKIKNDSHCHPPSKIPEAVPVFMADDRKRDGEKIAARVESLSGTCQLTAIAIAKQLSEELGYSVPTSHVRHIQQKLRKEKFGPYSATQLFVEILKNDQEGARHCQIHRNETTGKIDAITWTYESAIELLKRHHHLAGFDCTYKVNRFGMPLLEGTGVTNLGSNFTFFFGLVSHEDDYEVQIPATPGVRFGPQGVGSGQAAVWVCH